MLNPNCRSLYISSLIPPPGMVFDEAIATTFSMDPLLLLEAPVYLALMATDAQTEPDLISVLKAIRKYSRRITIYVQKGRIQVPQISAPNPLFGLLEKMVIEVSAPGGGVFHPKIWAIRFISPDQISSMYRLVVLTRNMTNDHSWDLSLQIEGKIGDKKLNSNKPLAHLFKLLPTLATYQPELNRIEQAVKFSEELHRVQWELPDGFEDLAFYLPGTKEFNWQPPKANRMVIISPFCSDSALHFLADEANTADALISRAESLSELDSKTLTRFSHCFCLDEEAETDDGEEEYSNKQPLATGLHAKVYLFETQHYSEYTHLIMGSANATKAALIDFKNVEILVGLIGKKKKIGGIDDLLSIDGLGEYLTDFDATKGTEIDTERQKAEKKAESVQAQLSEINFVIECRLGLKDDSWTLVLIGEIPFLDSSINVFAWPITVSRDFAVNILEKDPRAEIRLGDFSASSLTGFIAFEITTSHPDVTVRFVLNIPLKGVPEERNIAILQNVINNQDGFIRYLLLWLADDTISELEPANSSSSGFAKWLSRHTNNEDVPLLEEMTRTLSRYPERLLEISDLIRELSKGSQKTIIPESFLKLWSVFESARKDM